MYLKYDAELEYRSVASPSSSQGGASYSRTTVKSKQVPSREKDTSQHNDDKSSTITKRRLSYMDTPTPGREEHTGMGIN